MPLEQANGNAVPASDLYSLGATLLYLITRRSPEEFCQGLRFKIPPNLNLSEDFKTWLETLLEPDSDDRFSSAKEALNVLKNPPNKKEDKKIWIVGIGLVAVTLSGLFLFNQYKWAILNHLAFPTPEEVCDINLSMREYDKLTIDYWKSGGHLSPSDFKKCLFWSAKNNHATMIQWLIKNGADVNLKNNYGYTPFHYAVSDSNFETVETLIENGADVNVKNNYGYTPLHYAVSDGNFETVETLIENGADVNVKNNYGYTPLHYAVSSENSKMVEMLMNNGADVNIKDIDGKTPLNYAKERGHSKLVEFLIKNGAKD
jgi:predicted nucleic acid-binding OB-fold protein